MITIDFDKHQNKTRETRFPLDNLTYKSITAYHENGKISESGFYGSRLKKDGVWTCFDEQGKLTKTEIYENGKLISTE